MTDVASASSARPRAARRPRARQKLRQVLREHEDGIVLDDGGLTVAQAVNDWLDHGLVNRDVATKKANRSLSNNHVTPYLGARRLRDLTAREVDAWLAALARSLSARTLRGVHACLNRSVRRAMARDQVKRNVVELCTVPRGRAGRPSKSLTASEARAVVVGTAGHRMHNFIVVALLTGARTEELRALRWEHVHLERGTEATAWAGSYLEVWRSVRTHGDTKTAPIAADPRPPRSLRRGSSRPANPDRRGAPVGRLAMGGT